MESDYKETIDQTLDRIKACDGIDEETRDTLLAFHDAMQQHNIESSKSKEISGIRMNGYLGDMHRLARDTGEEADLLATLDPDRGEEAMTDVVTWTNENYSGSSLDTVHTSLRAFGRFMAEDADGEKPDRFEKAALGNREDDQPAPDASEVLYWEDVVKLIVEGSFNSRTSAMILFLWATGARPMSEFWELRYRHVDDRGDHLLVSLPSHSKTVRRTVRIDVGAPTIRKWLFEKHPANDRETGPEPDTYLWTLLEEDELIDYQDIRRSIKRAARHAEMTKPCNPEHFRKSRASVLAGSRWVTQRDLEYHFGWVRGSRVAAHYIAEFATRSRKHIAKADGADVELDEEVEPIVPVICDSCDEWTARFRDECLWCSAEVIAEEARTGVPSRSELEGNERLLDLIVDGTVTADHLTALKHLKPIIQTRGKELWDRLDGYITHAEQIAD